MSHPESSPVSRRSFIRRTGLATGAAMMGAQAALSSTAGADAAVGQGELPQRILGRTGASVTTFTLGTAACGCLPPPEIADIVHVALDEGVNAVDTSEKYRNAQEGVGLALEKRREEVFLSTKVFANSISEAEASLEKSIRLLKTDHFDLLYYHSLGNLNVENAMGLEGVFTWLLKQKKAGKCRFVGVSGHHLPGRFAPFLESGEVDVALLAFNFVDRHTYNFEDRVLPLARKHNVGVVAMKVYGGAAGMKYQHLGPAQMPARYIGDAFRYALTLPGVATANIGANSIEEVRDNIRMAKQFQPLSDEELAGLLQQGEKLAAEWGEHYGLVEEKA